MIASALAENGLCEHHNLHTEDCGYSEGVEGSPCTHEHTEDCYIIETNCIHSHDETCYSGEISADNNATRPMRTRERQLNVFMFAAKNADVLQRI